MTVHSHRSTIGNPLHVPLDRNKKRSQRWSRRGGQKQTFSSFTVGFPNDRSPHQNSAWKSNLHFLLPTTADDLCKTRNSTVYNTPLTATYFLEDFVYKHFQPMFSITKWQYYSIDDVNIRITLDLLLLLCPSLFYLLVQSRCRGFL
jgi:hypothetical protein